MSRSHSYNKMTGKRVSILGVPLDSMTKAELKRRLADMLVHRRGTRIVTPNPEFLLLAQHHQEFFAVLRDADLSLPDGIGLKFAGWVKRINLNRFTGAGLVSGLLNFAQAKGMRVAILNWKQGLSSDEDIRQAVLKSYPKLQLHVESAERDYDHDMSAVKQFAPDILFAALGAPWQDILIYRHLHEIPSARLGMGVGGSFDYMTKKMPRAPKFFQALGFEWLWRLLLNPAERWKRIWRAVVVFPLTVIAWELRRFRFRPNVVGMVINRFGETVILNARGRGDYWGLPQGGVDGGENKEAAARREVFEETGLVDLKLIGSFENIYSYHWSKPYTYKGYKGQKQSLFVFRYNGQRQAVKPNPFEHKAYRWVKISDLVRKSSPVHKQQYELFLEKFRSINKVWETKKR